MNNWSGSVIYMKLAVILRPISITGNKVVISIIIINMILKIIIKSFVFNEKTPITALSWNHRRKKLLRQRWQGA